MPGEAVPAGDLAGVPVRPGWGCSPGRPLRLPLSTGAPVAPGEPVGPPVTPGVPVAPGRTRPPGLPRLPFSNGDPVAAGEAIGLPPAVGAVAAGEAPAGPRPAAVPVGGGIFFGFSVLIFCFSCASLGTPAQPFSIFGLATFAFTLGGAAPGADLVSF